MLDPNTPIPVGSWRLGTFALVDKFFEDYSEEWMREYVTTWVHRSGVSVASSTVRPLSLSMTISGMPATVWGAWVNNQTTGLTTVEFIKRSSMPAVFMVEAAPELVETYLNTFQGTWGSRVKEGHVYKWSTPDTPLRPGVWYPTAAFWMTAPPSIELLKQKLKSGGFNLFWTRGYDWVKPIGDNGLLFWAYSGTTPHTVEDLKQALGATSVAVNMLGAVDDPDLTWLDGLAEEGEEFLKNVSDAGTSLAKGFKNAAGGAKTAINIAAWLLEWGPLLVAGGAAAYFGNKAYKTYKKTKPRKVAA